MSITIPHAKYGTLVYDENIWTGKRTLLCNNTPCTKLGRNSFQMEDGTVATLKGSTLTGVKLLLGGETIQVSAPAKWYEYALALLPFVFDMIWGNIPAAIEMFPIVSGAIGGLICAVGAVLSFFLMRKTSKWWLKVIIGIAVGAVAILICYAIALAILSA